MQKILKNPWVLMFVCWFVSLVATTGSLFFSQVMGYSPCVLCWYQRIAMYPLLLIFSISLVKETKETDLFALPLSIIGLLIALYHNLIQWEIIPEAASPCVQAPIVLNGIFRMVWVYHDPCTVTDCFFNNHFVFNFI